MRNASSNSGENFLRGKEPRRNKENLILSRLYNLVRFSDSETLTREAEVLSATALWSKTREEIRTAARDNLRNRDRLEGWEIENL